jgi:hypothetical protein
MIPLPAADQQRFDTLYNTFALDQARRLSNVGIDGVPVFREAQRLLAADPVACTPANSGVQK